MALNRRNGQRFEANIWPGFVDAMTALLLVLVFVLSIFMIVQFMLRETITVQDNELDSLSSEVLALADALGLERDRSQDLADQTENLTSSLEQSLNETERQQNLIATLNGQVSEQATRIGSFEEQVAGLLSTRNSLESQLSSIEQERAALRENVENLTADNADATARASALTARISDLEAGLSREISEKEAAQLALAQARSEIDVGEEEARLAAARREALDALVADLRTQSDEQSTRLTEAESALSQADADRLADAAAAEALRERLRNADAELTAMTLSLEAQRQEAEDTLTLLAAAKAAETDLNDRLINAVSAARAERETSQEEARQQLEISQEARADAEAQVAILLSQLQIAQGDGATVDTLRSQLQEAQSATQAVELELSQAQQDADRTARDLLAQLSAAQSNSETESKSLREELAAALAAENAAQEQISVTLTAAQQRQALLATAETELAAEKEVSLDGQRKIEALNQQVAQLRQQLGGLQDLLDASSSRDSDSNVQIQALGTQLNTALAQVAAEQRRTAEEQRRRAELEERERIRLEAEATELKSYRSEFFGQLRTLLGDQDGIRIEGDRFVFASEVLFQPGQATLSAAGRGEIAKVAEILTSVADDIPDVLDWIIRVDGHTDNVPFNGRGSISDNWELSQARALSVVRYMSGSLGIPPNRLAANGFGEFQPIATGNSVEARAQNRRIELKLTEK